MSTLFSAEKLIEGIINTVAKKTKIRSSEITYISKKDLEWDLNDVETRYILTENVETIPQDYYLHYRLDGNILISKLVPRHPMKLLDYLFADITGCEVRSVPRDCEARPYESSDETLRRKAAFPAFTEGNRLGVKATSYYGFMQMWYFLNFNIANAYRRVVVDANCGSGGDALRFAQYCPHVHAIEKDEDSLRYAYNNYDLMVSCGLITPGKFQFYLGRNEEYVLKGGRNLLDVPPGSILYVDPDWGEKEDGYNVTEEKAFVMKDVTFAELPRHIHPNFEYVVCKVPLASTTFGLFETTIMGADKVNSYKIVVIKNDEGNTLTQKTRKHRTGSPKKKERRNLTQEEDSSSSSSSSSFSEV